MSAFGGKADVIQGVAECPLIAISGHLLVRRVLLGALGPDRLAACLGDQSMCLPQVRKARSIPPRATTTPAQAASRRVDLRLIKEAEARWRGPRPVPMEIDPTRVGKVFMSNHPGRPRAGILTLARNDHVTPPSVYWQDAHAHSCGKERPWRPEQVAWASRAWKDRSRDTGQKSPDCKWSAIAPGADIGPRYVCFGCGRDAVLLVLERWYDFPEFGGYLGNVGLDRARPG